MRRGVDRGNVRGGGGGWEAGLCVRWAGWDPGGDALTRSEYCMLLSRHASAQICIGVCPQLQEVARTCCVVRIALPPPIQSSSSDV